MLRGEKILVTGPAGNFARSLVKELAKNNEVHGLARFSNPHDQSGLEGMGVICHKLDLARDSLENLPEDFAYVMHAGAMVMPHSEKDQSYTMEVNVQGTGRIMEHCKQVKSFLHCSTASVYHHQSQHALKESDPLGIHIHNYSLSKVAAEEMAKFACEQWQIPTVIIRMGTFYGPDTGGPLIRLDRMARGREVWVNPDRPNRFALIYQTDAIELGIKTLTMGRVPALVMNWGGPPVSVEDYCTYAGKLIGVEPRFKYTAEAYPGSFFDLSLMKELLGECKVDWKDGIHRVVEHRYPTLLGTA